MHTCGPAWTIDHIINLMYNLYIGEILFFIIILTQNLIYISLHITDSGPLANSLYATENGVCFLTPTNDLRKLLGSLSTLLNTEPSG